MGRIRVGVSGWSYRDWVGTFFPSDLPRGRHVEYITRRFDTAEVNVSFYRLQRPETYHRYARTAPAGFRFAVKGSRFITHAKKLKDIETPLANFFASGVLRLGPKLGPMLWQFPAMKWDIGRVEEFVALLPKDSEAAARLADRHDHRLEGRSWTETDRKRRIRHALEFRHDHFHDERVVRLCRAAGIALAFSDSGGEWSYTEELTADFVYLRLHGDPVPYASRYTDERLSRWAERIHCWSAGGEPADAVRITERPPPKRGSRDVYVYFDNDQNAHAPRDAERLRRMLAET